MASEGQSWQDGKSLAECNKYMLTNSVSTDVTFIVGETKKQVRAHKYVLGSRSSVFYAMLFGPMAESNAAINIPDIEPEIFLEILRYLYYEDVTFSYDNVTSLMFAADKYNIMGVMNRCVEYLSSSVTVETVCNVLDISVTLQNEELINKCLDFVFEKSEEVLQSVSFLHLQRDSLKLILQSDELAVSETLIYESMKKWGRTQCEKNDQDISDSNNIRDMIGDLKFLIRFTTMDREDFVKIVSIDNVLNSDEKVQVFQVYGGITAMEEQMFCNINQRTSNQFSSYRSLSYADTWTYDGTPDRIDFMVSDKVKIMGYILCSSHVQSSLTVDAKLCCIDTVLAAVKTPSYYTRESTFVVMFQSGVYIEPNIRYTADVTISGQKSIRGAHTKCCFSNSQFYYTSDGVEFKVTLLPKIGTDGGKDQIYGIIFRKTRNK